MFWLAGAVVGLAAVGTLLAELSVIVARVHTNSRVRSGAVIVATGLTRLEGDHEDKEEDDDGDAEVEGGSRTRELLALGME